MRLFLLISIFFCTSELNAQGCLPNSNVTVNICWSKLAKDSLCSICEHCRGRLVAKDSSFSIINYIVRAGGDGFEDIVEVFNTGSAFNEAKKLLSKVRPGNFVEFKCIRAKDKDGNYLYITAIESGIKVSTSSI